MLRSKASKIRQNRLPKGVTKNPKNDTKKVKLPTANTRYGAISKYESHDLRYGIRYHLSRDMAVKITIREVMRSDIVIRLK